jgi:RimJ/RimL family protein N-acetyltransferase
MRNPFLIGSSIYLRPLEREDAEVLAPYFNDPEITRTILSRPPISFRAEADFLEKLGQNESDLVLGIVIKATDRLIGGTGLHQLHFKNRSGVFGISIGAHEEWGKGYGLEATRLIVNYAFETLNLNRVSLHVFEYNTRALRVYEKAGFRREGVLRQDNYREGRYWDSILMAILRAEWDAQKTRP